MLSGPAEGEAGGSVASRRDPFNYYKQATNSLAPLRTINNNHRVPYHNGDCALLPASKGELLPWTAVESHPGTGPPAELPSHFGKFELEMEMKRAAATREVGEGFGRKLGRFNARVGSDFRLTNDLCGRRHFIHTSPAQIKNPFIQLWVVIQTL